MPLNPGQSPVHIPSQEDRSNGGKQVTPLKVVANSIRSRKWCSPNCLFVDSCPMLPLSMSREQEVNVGGKIKHPCKLKEAPPHVQRRINNMFLNGEDGLLTEIKSALFLAGTNLSTDPKERIAYADALGRLHRVMYGDKTKVDTQEPIEITVRQLSSARGTAQEVQIRKETAVKLLEKRTIDPNDVPEISDPESLFTSPVIDAIVTSKKDDMI